MSRENGGDEVTNRWADLQAHIQRAGERSYVGSTLSPTTRFRTIKSVILRVARLITREQFAFNQEVVQALSNLAQESRVTLQRAVVHDETEKADHVMHVVMETRLEEGVSLRPAASTMTPEPTGQLKRINPARRARPKLVLLSTYRVGRRGNGGELRCFHLSKCLSAAFDVEIVSQAAFGGSPSRDELLWGVTETVIPRSVAEHAAEIAQRRQMNLEFPLADILTPELIQFAPDYLDAVRRATERTDVVLLAHPYLHRVLELTGTKAPMVYDAVDAELVMKESMLPRTPEGQRLLQLVRDTEMAAVQTASVVCTCSEADGNALRAEYGRGHATWIEVPNGVDLASVEFVTGSERKRRRDNWIQRFQMGGSKLAFISHSAMFLASGHPPSWEAAEAIIETARQIPDVGFFLVGTHSPRFRQWHLPDNVAAVGVVPDFARRVLLGAVDVGLNPMISGGGSNLKVPEYFGSGVPVVATSFGCRGFAVEDGVHLLIRAADDLAEAVERIVQDRGQADALAVAARELAAAKYQWSIVGSRMTKAVADLAGVAVSDGSRG